MTGSLCGSFSRLTVGTHRSVAAPAPVPRVHLCSSFTGQSLRATQQRSTAVKVGFFVDAAQNSLRRQRTAERRRVYNKQYKSAVATRIKKALKGIDDFKTAMPESEDELKPVERLISEAYAEIDKCVSRGIFHDNTAARRKSRLAVAKRKLLIEAGLYTPVAA
ncbi:hypothetical protein WJX84_005178 [Apatococcus fuscideae]|uniref:30S ribosomal protein S20 n=1 Tax=Apatococcus fuscideae TaxID=2026836 RepID=A0AAW1SEH3_9CHLO